MNFEEFQQEFTKQAPIKIQYYLNLFLNKGINEDTVTEFLSDNFFLLFYWYWVDVPILLSWMF